MKVTEQDQTRAEAEGLAVEIQLDVTERLIIFEGSTHDAWMAGDYMEIKRLRGNDALRS
jgi:hypothetical protein